MKLSETSYEGKLLDIEVQDVLHVVVLLGYLEEMVGRVHVGLRGEAPRCAWRRDCLGRPRALARAARAAGPRARGEGLRAAGGRGEGAR